MSVDAEQHGGIAAKNESHDTCGDCSLECWFALGFSRGIVHDMLEMSIVGRLFLRKARVTFLSLLEGGN